MKLSDYMSLWAEWMREDDAPDRYRTIASGFDEARTNYAVSVEDSANLSDMRERGYGEIVDACIDSMPTHERTAIHQVFGFARVGQLEFNAGMIYTACLPRLARIVRQRLPLDDEPWMHENNEKKVA